MIAPALYTHIPHKPRISSQGTMNEMYTCMHDQRNAKRGFYFSRKMVVLYFFTSNWGKPVNGIKLGDNPFLFRGVLFVRLFVCLLGCLFVC